MATLNSGETEQLRSVKKILDHVSKNGYDPESDLQKHAIVGNSIKEASKAIHTIIQMKGYYPL